ncbi:MAG: glutamine--fructose-6-phosphate transaminase (isomerizing) [Deltaproteobacteria bacterium]|nr:glutamine--fructose-6-phosphate transaminase (isomerizing) [Deltaproteobacteria bacterium]
MCGIVGYVGDRPCADILVDGLKRLEYRGYDSAGIAVVNEGVLDKRRAEGKLANLVSLLSDDPVDGPTGIGHTRWATHGRPAERNAHPHRKGSIAVVHNGIIENHLAIKSELSDQGHVFKSETDTEVIAHLVWKHREAGHALAEAVRMSVLRLEGAYSIVVLDADTPNTLVAARLASPLVLGVADGEGFVASDIPAILAHTREMAFIDDGVMAIVTPEGSTLRRIEDDAPVELKTQTVTWSPAMAEKGGHKHFMLKEICEQPDAISNTIRGRISLERSTVELPELDAVADALSDVSHFYIVACGTSWHAGMVGRYLFEELAKVSPHVELASEFRYRRAPIDKKTLVLAVSQSGETADTLAAIKDARGRGATVLSICNVIEASIPRASHATLYTHAGPEISVASTKAFTTQVAALHLLALHMGATRGAIDEATLSADLDALVRVPAILESMIGDDTPYMEFARAWHEATSMLFLGRGNLFPLALEGALKLKEISYIHAEGYAAGEMKHGPIALVEETVPSVFLNPRDDHFGKVRSNLQEVKARGGPVLTVYTEGHEDATRLTDFAIPIPEVPHRVLPLICAIPMQLLAYHMADFKGTDVDQPRNLAKSVTVE